MAPGPVVEPTLDLSAILEAGPPQRRAVLDMARVNLDALGVGELLELSRAVEVEPEALGSLMRTGGSGDKARLMVALAWIIARRAEPELTLEDVSTWAIEVIGKAPPNRAQRRARGARKTADPTPPPTGSRPIARSGSSGSRGR